MNAAPPAPEMLASTITTASDGAGTAPEEREVPFEFHGSGSEYFKIWIVNTALTILTLGVFSAWAKVRSRRYFYGNTRVDGSSFDYLARPKQILIGRLIVGALLLALGITSQTLPVVYFILIGVVFLIAPWIIVRALQFNARYSAYRNVRFSFQRTVNESYEVYLGLPLLCGITLGLLTPYMERMSRRFIFSGHSYGDQTFTDTLSTRAVYLVYLKMAGLAFFVMAPGLIAMFIAALGGNLPAEADAARRIFIMMLPAYALLFIGGVFLSSFQHAHVTNMLLDGGQVGRILGFRSTLRTLTLFRLQIGYGLLTILTLGLAYPWMRVALARYRAETLVLLIRGDLDTVIEEVTSRASAVADQLAEGFDFDIDLGF